MLYDFPTHEDLETFAETFLGIDYKDYDCFYEFYHGININGEFDDQAYEPNGRLYTR